MDKVQTILLQYLHHSHRVVNKWPTQLTMQQHVVAMLVSDQALNQTECVTVQKTWHSHLDSAIYYRLYLFNKNDKIVIVVNILKQINSILSLFFVILINATIHKKLVVLPIPVICCFGMTTSPCLDIGSFKSFMEDDMTSPNITRRPNSSVCRFYKHLTIYSNILTKNWEIYGIFVYIFQCGSHNFESFYKLLDLNILCFVSVDVIFLSVF